MVFVAPPITKVEKPFNLLEGAESLPKNKIAVFNYENNAYAPWGL